YVMPKFKPQKSVNFHTNKARPHHLSCIVRTFMLCFWILTVTVPDPGLNGNLASGPFGFLIEYPCSSVCVCMCVCVCCLVWRGAARDCVALCVCVCGECE